MVHHEGEKMSKSLGNLVMVRDLLESYSPDAIRLYLAGHHYRETWSHNLDELSKAEEMAAQLRRAATLPVGSGTAVDVHGREQELVQALNNDLDTPAALRVMVQLADEILAASARDNSERSNSQPRSTLRRMARIFGLRLDATGPEALVVTGWNEHLRSFKR
jgi:cysteinyl-tRNA synthetase